MSVKYCENCGAPMPENSKFCTECGLPFAAAKKEEKPVQPKTPEPEKAGEQIPDQPQSAESAEPRPAQAPQPSQQPQPQVPPFQQGGQPIQQQQGQPNRPAQAQPNQPAQPIRPAPVPVPPNQPVQQPIRPVPAPAPAPAAGYGPGGANPAYRRSGEITAEDLKGTPLEPINAWGWLGIFLLLGIPIVNVILLIVWACGGCRKNAKKSFARGVWITVLISVILMVVIGASVFYALFPTIEPAVNEILRQFGFQITLG